MLTIPLGKTGFNVSRLGFGSAPIGYLKTELDRASHIMNLLLDEGINLIDTAASYPGSEEAIRQAIGHRRDSFVIVSKCGSGVAGLPGKGWSAELIAATVDRSLKNLGTDRLDVMLLHSCDLKTLQAGEALGALVAARSAGKIRFAGYSGDNAAAAHAVTLSDIAVLETSVNLVDQINLRAALPGAVANNVGVLAKRPIANAAWKDLDQQAGLYKSYAKTYHERLKLLKLSPANLGISGPPETAWPELAMRFTLSQAGVHCAIIGTTHPGNALANISYAKKGPLPADVVEKIKSAYAAADPDGTWKGET